jgi:hypothetical protein
MPSISTDVCPTHRDRPDLYVVRPTLPPVTCIPWCMTANGHPDELFPDDQACLSKLPGDRIDTEDGGRVEACVVQRHDGSPATVQLYTWGGGDNHSGTAELTLEQARAHAHAVLAAVDLAAE